MEILAVLISLFGLMFFAYKGVNVLILAPIMALVATIFDSNNHLMATYTQIYMPAVGGYLVKYFPLFLLGAIFGQLMGDSGAAQSIGDFIAKKLGPKHAAAAVVTACGLLTYGGVSLFVVAFGIEPIARHLFKKGDVPRRFIPASIALGSFTFTMTALPGTPAIQNAIPMPFFGTTAFAAPGLGLIAAIIMAGSGLWWLNARIHKAKALGEGYGEVFEGEEKSENSHSGLNVWVAVLPLILVIVLNYVLSQVLIPSWSSEYLANDRFGNIKLKDVLGIWSIIIAIFLSIIVLLITQKKFLKKPLDSVNKGTMGSLLPIFNTASEVGYGATIASLASFAIIKSTVLGIFPTYPLISESISVNLLAGVTGSASGGLSIALKALASQYMAMAEAANISPELLHRVATLSCGGLDTLPHNGAVITLLAICKLNHKKSYFDIFMVAVAFPFLATATVVMLGSMLGSF
ncbi:MAG: transporter [Halobacteriovoraceae bacterium]|nr:transporter [Halobacteriovoraceae bacterium]|tara:strand:+ start:5108 stop:6493 length:1386 start_codon:yes stop_codon:yes gene_type:complete